MGVTEWCWTDYPDPQSQRSGWLEAARWINCIDPLPSAAGRPLSTVPSVGPEYRLEVLGADYRGRPYLSCLSFIGASLGYYSILQRLSDVCDRGGIGIRAGFRILWGNPWEFESPRSHFTTTFRVPALGRYGGNPLTLPEMPAVNDESRRS